MFTYLFQRAYTTWCVFWFLVPFVLTYPFQVLFTRRRAHYRHAHVLNRFWSSMALRMFFLPIKVEKRFRLDPAKRYVFTPNHSSYIDIPLILHTIPGFITFIGKSSLCKVPLWGPIYKKLYISVDRKNKLSRAKSYISSLKAIDEGRSLVIFPEGTISEQAGVQLVEFKDGPFRVAIEKQVPIVPITMPHNHLFLPDLNGKLKVRWNPLHIVLHEPIETKGLTQDDIEPLKNKVFQIIQNELNSKRNVDGYSHPTQAGPLSPAGV